ncbi:MAG TPA: choice-of-anchor D domain-containing protein [Verrucomicrobiae bacterium]|nr:choice-of-anchor D domain-containing protein [Verrucomicrobiae bacterium]
MYLDDVWIVTRRAVLFVFLLGGLVVTTPLSVLGTQSVTLAWNQVTNANVAGYKVYYGSASGNYTNFTSVGNVTNATIAGLTEGATYYFAATTLSTSGLESGYSSAVSYTIPNAVPTLQVTPGSISYGTILSGTSKTNSFTVANVGTGTLSGSASVSAPFSVVAGGSYSLGAGQTQLVVVAFSPLVASNYNQSVSFSGGTGTNTTVTGSATNAPVPTPILQVTPGSIGYGTILSGTSKTNSFTVANVGTGTLSGSASVSAPFSVVAGGSYSLGAGQTQLVVVAFSPLVASNYNQSVSFSGGAGTNTTVTGSATNAPVLPTISAISVNATDVDLISPGLEIYSGTTVQFSAMATNAQTWQWSYSINGGASVVYTNSTSPITNISYYFGTNTVGDSYVWTLVVSNGQAWAESETNLTVEMSPNGGLTFAAASAPANGLLTASTIINGVEFNYIYQPLPSIGDVSSGTAVYNFTITNAGNYEIQALVNAPNVNANSFYVNIDSQPQDSTTIWDIMPLTSGFEQRLVSWRGNGSENNDQIVPKTFNLGAGLHQIVFTGREPGTALASFTLIPVASGTANTSQPPPTVSSLNHSVRAVADSALVNASTPTNYVAVAGQTVTLNAGAPNVSSVSTLAYQWRFNSVNLSMANDATLLLKNVTTYQSGVYTLVVSNEGGTTVSSPIILTVYPTAAATLEVATHPAGQFNLSIKGVPGYHYEVQASTNLADWIPLQTNTAPFLFTDPKAGKFKQRFYRTLFVQ